jgi:diadenosine tetraphosphate (Ap4A) HIT family hydrolase
MSSAVNFDSKLFDAGCVFCRMAFDPDLSGEPVNELLYSGRSHYVICGLGAWTPGYVLLVTHRHFDNFSHAPDETQPEFKALFADIERLFLAEFGELTIFEHGAVGDEKRAGGCINHAHVHFIGKKLDLCRELSTQFRSITIPDSDVSGRHLPPLQTPYLYVKQQDEDARAYQVERALPTQFLRQKVASRIGKGEYWDYKLHPFTENIMATIEMFRGRIGSSLRAPQGATCHALAAESSP